MNHDLIVRIESEYDLETGAIGQLRGGHVDEASMQRLLALLQQCPSASDAPIDGRLVRLLWWMPWIAEWQAQRLEREGKSADLVHRAGEAIFNELEGILGSPDLGAPLPC